MPLWTGTPKDGQLWLPRGLVAPRRRWLFEQEGHPVSEEIKVITQSKSQAQLGAIFGLIIATLLHEFDERAMDTSDLLGSDVPSGTPIWEGFLRYYLYAVCPLVSDKGERITLSHKDAETANVSVWMKMVCDWSLSKWGIFIPEPDKNWKDKE